MHQGVDCIINSLLGYGILELQFSKDSLFLVTGGAGFIGSNLCEAILNIGYRVRCLDDLSTGKQSDIDLFLGIHLQEMLNTNY